MANVDKYAPGSFCWVELATTDQNAAKTFYTSLFGWAVMDTPMGPGNDYSIFQLRGRACAAGYTLQPDQRARGVPVHWSLFIAVDSADQSAAKAAQLGASIVMPPFDVPDAGRMAVIHDPTGAVFSLWQGGQIPGLGVTGEPGALCWADLSTSDPDGAAKFYSSLLGWTYKRGQNDPSGYTEIKNGDQVIGGIPPAHAGTASHWLIYFMVADVGATVAKATQLGAKTLVAPMDMPGVGTWAILSDPQSAAFAVFKSAT